MQKPTVVCILTPRQTMWPVPHEMRNAQGIPLAEDSLYTDTRSPTHAHADKTSAMHPHF